MGRWAANELWRKPQLKTQTRHSTRRVFVCVLWVWDSNSFSQMKLCVSFAVWVFKGEESRKLGVRRWIQWCGKHIFSTLSKNKHIVVNIFEYRYTLQPLLSAFTNVPLLKLWPEVLFWHYSCTWYHDVLPFGRGLRWQSICWEKVKGLSWVLVWLCVHARMAHRYLSMSLR